MLINYRYAWQKTVDGQTTMGSRATMPFEPVRSSKCFLPIAAYRQIEASKPNVQEILQERNISSRFAIQAGFESLTQDAFGVEVLHFYLDSKRIGRGATKAITTALSPFPVYFHTLKGVKKPSKSVLSRLSGSDSKNTTIMALDILKAAETSEGGSDHATLEGQTGPWDVTSECYMAGTDVYKRGSCSSQFVSEIPSKFNALPLLRSEGTLDVQVLEGEDKTAFSLQEFRASALATSPYTLARWEFGLLISGVKVFSRSQAKYSLGMSNPKYLPVCLSGSTTADDSLIGTYARAGK
ncbi:hypothetical protein DXG01_011459 [Tephrocybe rancida]|nr:hypothetical protein DXG01_011459 [Tephrocybe rancida]